MSWNILWKWLIWRCPYLIWETPPCKYHIIIHHLNTDRIWNCSMIFSVLWRCLELYAIYIICSRTTIYIYISI
jgi:hypothetical protein